MRALFGLSICAVALGCGASGPKGDEENTSGADSGLTSDDTGPTSGDDPPADDPDDTGDDTDDPPCTDFNMSLDGGQTMYPSVVRLAFKLNCAGEAVTDKTEEDFTILEDGDEVSRFESDFQIVPTVAGYQMSTALVLDMSGSIVESGFLPSVQAAAKSFLDTMSEGQDVAIYLFDGREDIQEWVAFTNSQEALEAGVDLLDSYEVYDPSTNLNGAVINGLAELDNEASGYSDQLFEGTLVVFTDGTDQAGRVTDEAAITAVETSEHGVYTVGLGAEVDTDHLASIGSSGSFVASDVDELEATFDELAVELVNEANSVYVIAYCSPKRSGEHELTLELNGADVSISYDFNADGFEPGCDPTDFVPAEFLDLDEDGYRPYDGDCDDEDASAHPGATEVCDGADNDCDGDIDGYDDDTDDDGDGYSHCDSDCDDTDPEVHPGASEVCNGIDDDCDELADDASAVDAVDWYADNDGDGYGSSYYWDITTSCDAPAGHVDNNEDCDDSDAAIHPGGTEVCDGDDNDCDGDVDAYDDDTDDDGDGYSVCGSDCDDEDASVSPSATEVCNGIDDDCDGRIDGDDAVDATLWYLDGDGDGYGSGGPTASCSAPAGYVANNDDCDDGSAAVHPGATEICDEIDNDCDGRIDEVTGSSTTYYPDWDGDGYGTTAGSVTVSGCEDAPTGSYVGERGDCDDSDDSIHPDADEICNDVDDDCNGSIDDEAVDARTWYLDEDDDGYGVSDEMTTACDEPAGYAPVDTDCDDEDRRIHPTAVETCDGVDNDCDDLIDEGCSSSRILDAYESLSCDETAASIREQADFIDVSYNSGGTWNDSSTSMGFRIGDGEGTYYEASYIGSPWQLVTIEFTRDASSYTYTGNYSSWDWTTRCSGTVDDIDTAGVVHVWSMPSIFVTKTEIWEDDGRVSRVWFEVENVGAAPIENMRLVFGVDPDQDYGYSGSYSTLNDTRDAGDYAESVGGSSGWTIGFGSCNAETEDVGHTGWSTDADAVFEDYAGGSGDNTMHWRHTEDEIGGGGSASFGFLVTVGQTPEEAEEAFDFHQPLLCTGGA